MAGVYVIRDNSGFVCEDLSIDSRSAKNAKTFKTFEEGHEFIRKTPELRQYFCVVKLENNK